jgi:hypothetical protein
VEARPPKAATFPEIPVLEDYASNPGSEFWRKFPRNDMPSGPCTPVKIDRLRILVNKHKSKWNPYEKRIAKRALKILSQGAISFTKSNLPPLRCKNAASTLIYGKEMTDTIADWVKNKIVSGPFEIPPLCNFRCNALMAAVQPGKIRPIMNLSTPKNHSLNDNLKAEKIPKIFMATAKDFSFAVHNAGFNAKISKMDIVSAYKIIPSHPSAWRLHGFKWLEHYFVDTTTIFGSKAAPAHFDCLGFLLALLACSTSKIEKKYVFRTLDDTPIVTPANSAYGKKFVKAYRNICNFVNVKLAPVDCNKEKAFENSTNGTVLGVQFNTKNLTWSISSKKSDEIKNLIFIVHNSPAIHLKTLQQLMGKWESISQMCNFARGFRWPLLNFMKKFAGDDNIILSIPCNVKADMKIWAAIAGAAEQGLPISPPQSGPPLLHVEFCSDAAGRRPPGSTDQTGVASIGTVNKATWFGCHLFWKPQFTWLVQDNSAAYEMVGLLLPILILYKQLRHQDICLLVDNEAIVWSWPKRRMKNDAVASILIRTLHILEAFIPCRIFVEHLPRVSNKSAKLVDNLSRKSTTTAADLRHLTHSECDLPEPFRRWLENPKENWHLGTEIVTCLSK